jgi:hypothetical protein
VVGGKPFPSLKEKLAARGSKKGGARKPEAAAGGGKEKKEEGKGGEGLGQGPRPKAGIWA